MSNRAVRYGAAVGLTIVAVVLALVLQNKLAVPDGLIYAGMVAACARFLGTGPSLLASALAVIAIDITMLPPIGSVEFTHPEELAYLAVFIILVLVISGATHSLRIATSRAESLTSRTTRLLDVTTALAEAELPRDVARVVITHGLDVVEATVGLVGIASGGEFQVLDWRPSPASPNAAMPHIDMSGDGPLATAMRSRRAVWIESRERLHEQFPKAAERMRADGATAFMAIPLLHGDSLVGALMLGFASPQAFGATSHAFSYLLAQSVASALARARTFELERDGRQEAETLARTREEVLGVVAHDLRNPLGVAGSVMQMLEFDLPADQREALLATGTRAVKQMGRLIGDLLDVMRFEAGRLALETEEVTVSSVLTHAEENIRHAAAEGGIVLTVEEPETSLRIRADRGRLAQVFANLLGNAVKFTPRGGRVTLRARRDGNEVVFEVSDTGPGVSPENQTHLFDRFWQARRTDRRGVGLGLAISKGIVEAHGGRIWVISKQGHGSRFFFAIPATDGSTSAARAS